MKITTLLEYNLPPTPDSDGIMHAARRGDTVHLPPGRYAVREPIELPVAVSIVSVDAQRATLALEMSAEDLAKVPGSQQVTLVTARGGLIKELDFDCKLPLSVPAESVQCAIGGAIAYWGTGEIHSCSVWGVRNGAAKEGFALFASGCADHCRVCQPYTNPNAKSTEITAIAAGQIQWCQVDMRGCTSVTHGFTLLDHARPSCMDSVARYCTAGFYTDSHALIHPWVVNNMIDSCQWGVQLSGAADPQTGQPVRNGVTRNAYIARNSIRTCNTGVYLYAPIAYADMDKAQPHTWHDGAMVVQNHIEASIGVRLQAAHHGYLGRVTVADNLIDAPDLPLAVENEHVWKGGKIGGVNRSPYGRQVPWRSWTAQKTYEVVGN